MNFFEGLARRRRYFVISLSVLALDQLTKLLADGFLRTGNDVEIIPGLFDLSYSRNPGGLFGSFSDWQSPLRYLLLTVLPLLAIAWIAHSLALSKGLGGRTRLGLSLILGGATGNLIDRLLRGEVIDFLDVYASAPRLADWLIGTFGTAHWPTFNLADSSIVCGAGFLLLSILAPRRSAAGISESSTAASRSPQR